MSRGDMNTWQQDVRAKVERAIQLYAEGKPDDLQTATGLLDQALANTFESYLQGRATEDEWRTIRGDSRGYYERLAAGFLAHVAPATLGSDDAFKLRFIYRSMRNAVQHRFEVPPRSLVAQFIDVATRCTVLAGITTPERENSFEALEDAQNEHIGRCIDVIGWLESKAFNSDGFSARLAAVRVMVYFLRFLEGQLDRAVLERAHERFQFTLQEQPV